MSAGERRKSKSKSGRSYRAVAVARIERRKDGRTAALNLGAVVVVVSRKRFVTGG